ncbi:MAG: exosortase/archaeosortase family protein, partial [Verrucomicrobia bacterium]|nr:exosortase/archaeosortase family protein [Verrucomicrobiota bacterium]
MCSQRVKGEEQRVRSWRGDAVAGIVIGGLLVVLFHYFGSAEHVPGMGRSLFRWVFLQWTDRSGDFSHAWLMPLISLAFVWFHRRQIAEAPKRVCWLGVTSVAGLLLAHWLMVRAEQPRLSLLVFAALTWVIPFSLYGFEVARWLAFPCLYLMLCFGSYFLVALTYKLRLMSSVIAAVLLNGLGIATERHGTALFSDAGGGFSLDVADPCSGLRSLIVITALCAPYAVLTQPRWWGKCTLFVLSIPFAAIANICRILILAGVAASLGQEVAMKL